MLNADAAMGDMAPNRKQTMRVGAGEVFAQVGIVGFEGQIGLEALRLLGLPEAAAPAVLYACPLVPVEHGGSRRREPATCPRWRAGQRRSLT